MTILQKIFAPIAILLLIILYISASIPLGVRQIAHCVTWYFDYTFDFVAKIAGFDPRFWPLPKASDNSLPWK